MTGNRKVISDDELLARLENDRDEDIERGDNTTSLKTLVNDDIKNNLSITKVLPMLVTIIGGMYIAVTQIYTFTTSIDNVSQQSSENQAVISQISERQNSDRQFLEELINSKSGLLESSLDSLTTRVTNIESKQRNLVETFNNRYERMENRVSDLENTNERSINSLRDEVREQSNEIKDLETEIRVLNIQNQYNNTSKQDSN